MRRFSGLLLALLVTAAPAAAQGGDAYLKALREQAAAASSEDAVTVTTSTSRGAVWVGDNIVYSLRFSCAPGIELHLDDLDAAFLEGAGWEIADQRIESADNLDGGTFYRVEYDLVTFQVGPTYLEIPALEVRYYRTGTAVGEAVDSESVVIGAVRIPLRSMLPEEDQVQSIRPVRLPVPEPGSRAARWLGVLLLVAGAGLAAVTLVGRLRTVSETESETPVVATSSWSELQGLIVQDVEQAREAYSQLDQVLRARLQERVAGTVAAQTATELDESLPDQGWSELLGQCRTAKYAPDSMVPQPEQWRQDLARAKQLAGRNVP